MKRLLKRLHTAQTRGQSLVEMAIIAPILIFFLLGIFEVGWALRNYLVLVNVNREITRFAIRPGYMDFSTEQARNSSYSEVKRWTELAIGDQLDLDFASKTTLIISHLVIDTGQPCQPPDPLNPSAPTPPCECGWFDPDDPLYDPSKAFTQDDIIIHPGMNNYEYQSFTVGITDTVTGIKQSLLDYDALTTQLALQNNKFNCEVVKKGGRASANNMVATELFHDQAQLFGFPIISNPFTDPLPLYTHTVMRLIGGARSSGGVEGSLITNIDTIGEVCFAYPFIVSETQLNDPAVNPGSIINVLDGKDTVPGPASHKGWLLWEPDPDDPSQTLKYQIQFPQMSVNSYKDPIDGDSVLDPGDTDHVKSYKGNHLGQVKDLIDALAGQDIIIPVWSSWDSGTETYIVSRFIVVRITGDVTPPTIDAQWIGNAPDACNSPEL